MDGQYHLLCGSLLWSCRDECFENQSVPLRERGLERFQHPQHPLEMLSNGSEPLNTAFFRPALGGDLAALRGMAKFLLQWHREALTNGEPAVFDLAFIAEHTHGVDDYLALLDASSWDSLVEQSGLSLDELQQHQPLIYGQHQLLLAPEYQQNPALQQVMQMLEQPDGLIRLLHDITQDDSPKLLLGKESGYAELANVSLIAQRYQAQPARFIALLGPRRMNYARLIPLVEACARQLNLNLNRR